MYQYRHVAGFHIVRVVDGDGIAALRVALAIHDEQVRIAERSEIRQAINEVYRRVQSGDTYAEAISV